MALGNRMERAWDIVEAAVQRHRRKSLTIGFLVITLPQSAPATRDAVAWLAGFIPAFKAQVAMLQAMSMPELSFSWNLVTTPIGLAMMLFVLWEIRKADRRPSGYTRPEGTKPQSAANLVEEITPAAASARFDQAMKRADDTLARIVESGSSEQQQRADILMRMRGLEVSLRWRPHPNGLDIEALNIGNDVIDGFRLFRYRDAAKNK
jgi:hypothetical protein